MKAVMLSIQPRHCENIGTVIGAENGKPIYKKTIEVRKTRSKIETPFKCYIYATVGAYRDVYQSIPKEPLFLIHRENQKPTVAQSIAHEFLRSSTWGLCNGQVIGEFLCDRIEKFVVGSLACDDIEKQACLTYQEMIDYFYKPAELDGKTVKVGYGWHISDLKIYDKPKELGEFRRTKICPDWDNDDPFDNTENCYNCDHYIGCDGHLHLTCPPQSWCYVEEMSE